MRAWSSVNVGSIVTSRPLGRSTRPLAEEGNGCVVVEVVKDPFGNADVERLCLEFDRTDLADEEISELAVALASRLDVLHARVVAHVAHVAQELHDVAGSAADVENPITRGRVDTIVCERSRTFGDPMLRWANRYTAGSEKTLRHPVVRWLMWLILSGLRRVVQMIYRRMCRPACRTR